MSGLSENTSAFFAVIRRDYYVFLSYRTRLVSQALTSVFSLTLFYYVSRLVHVEGFTTPDKYFGFVVVGIALVGVLYSTPEALADRRRQPPRWRCRPCSSPCSPSCPSGSSSRR